MMTDEQAAMTADQRIAKDMCPECCCPLEGLSAVAHGATHWPTQIKATQYNQEALRRQAMCAAYDKAHEAR